MIIKINTSGSTRVAQLAKHLTSAQVVILWFMGSSPALGSVLTARSLEPPLDSVTPSLSVPPRFTLCLSKMKKKLKKILTSLGPADEPTRSNATTVFSHFTSDLYDV